MAHAEAGDGFAATPAPPYYAVIFTAQRKEAAIRAWKQNAEHLAAQRLGIARWYSRYHIRVAKAERAYSGPQGR